MIDLVIQAINDGELSSKNLTSAYLRENFCQDYGRDLYNTLNRGREILESVEQLNQYLWSYAPMVIHQWKKYDYDQDYMEDGKTTVVDYGCGQGLASLTFIANWDVLHEYITNFILIEPSAMALNRASAIIQCKYPDTDILAINKTLEELSDDDLSYAKNEIFIHLFSNILDLDFAEDFYIADFFEKITNNKAEHYIHIISHDRDHNGGSDNILKLFQYISEKYLDVNVFKGGKYAKSLSLKRYKSYKDNDTIHLYAHIQNSKGIFSFLGD